MSTPFSGRKVGHATVVTLDELTTPERRLLTNMYAGKYGEPQTVYSEPGRSSPSRPTMRALASLGLVTYLEGRDAGWDPQMWGAALTCVGSNVVFRAAGGPYGTHPGCGPWNALGRCLGCRAKRPLDAVAYEDYLDALSDEDCAHQLAGPRLYCVEHGWVRRDDITTQKVCLSKGTAMHEPSLFRV